MTPTTRTEYDAKLDAVERIIRQVRRYDGAQAADLIVYGKVPIKELARTELEPEEIASVAMGGATEEFRVVSDAVLVLCREWQDQAGDIMQIADDHERYTWKRIGAVWMHDEMNCWFSLRERRATSPLRPLILRWSQVDSLAAGERRR
jgi:hypothetical protein